MTWFYHNKKKCKRCDKWFDQGTNFDICPKCRNKKDGKLK